MHRTEDAFKTLDAARARFPKTFLCEFYTGVASLHVKNYAEAIRHFNDRRGHRPGHRSRLLDYRFYFQFGEACERNQEYKRADEYLQKCINLSPDFGEALNYLGYMLADRGEQLPRARALIEKAVQLEPKNGAYLDSLGWVLIQAKAAATGPALVAQGRAVFPRTGCHRARPPGRSLYGPAPAGQGHRSLEKIASPSNPTRKSRRSWTSIPAAPDSDAFHFSKHYTLEEARALLPSVRQWLDELGRLPETPQNASTNASAALLSRRR